VTGAERLALSTLPATPWKNGGGTTREIAAFPPGAGLDDFGWRLSVAEVERDGPFSVFSGVDRTIVLLDGAGMRLRDRNTGGEHVLTVPGVPHGFAGEAAIQARLIGGATSDFNAMVRRGQWSARVDSLRGGSDVAAADALLLLVGAGRWRVGAQDVLDPGQMLLWRAPAGGVAVVPADADEAPWLLAVRLCHDRP
jgi:environmental stress-induced protein Ves